MNGGEDNMVVGLAFVFLSEFERRVKQIFAEESGKRLGCIANHLQNRQIAAARLPVILIVALQLLLQA